MDLVGLAEAYRVDKYIKNEAKLRGKHFRIYSTRCLSPEEYRRNGGKVTCKTDFLNSLPKLLLISCNAEQ